MQDLEEYSPGRRLTVRVYEEASILHHTPPSRRPCHPRRSSDEADDKDVGLTLKIVQVFRPFTMTTVCRVRVVSTTADRLPSSHDDDDSADIRPRLGYLPSEFILKLYDRRHVVNLRDEYGEGRVYDQDKEAAYQKYRLETETETGTGKIICVWLTGQGEGFEVDDFDHDGQ